MSQILRVLLTCVCSVLLVGCVEDYNGDGHIVIGCLGDSNTDEHVFPIATPTWCSILTNAHAWENVNYAISFSTATPTPDNPHEPYTAVREMEHLLGDADEGLVRKPDIIIFAYGTVDLLALHVTPVDVLATLHVLDDAAAARGVALRYFATVPPALDVTQAENESIVELNALIRIDFPERYVEFYDGFSDPGLFLDTVHFNAAGQQLRAARAFTALMNGYGL